MCLIFIFSKDKMRLAVSIWWWQWSSEKTYTAPPAKCYYAHARAQEDVTKDKVVFLCMVWCDRTARAQLCHHATSILPHTGALIIYAKFNFLSHRMWYGYHIIHEEEKTESRTCKNFNKKKRLVKSNFR